MSGKNDRTKIVDQLIYCFFLAIYEIPDNFGNTDITYIFTSYLNVCF